VLLFEVSEEGFDVGFGRCWMGGVTLLILVLTELCWSLRALRCSARCAWWNTALIRSPDVINEGDVGGPIWARHQ